MQFTFPRLAIRLTILLLLSAAGWSQCTNPTSPGAVICTPTNDSTVVYLSEISVRSTPAQGATITGMIVYDNNVNIFQGDYRSIDILDGALYDGEHHIVANVWDSDGNLYQAKTNFYITGQGYGTCPQPSTPGVVICNPPAGAIYGTYVTVDASARGQSSITNLSFYLNGKLLSSNNNTWGLGIAVRLSGQGVNNTLKVVATDANGNQYSATKTLNAEYTYGQYSCFYTCSPGINVTAPVADAYIGNTFNLNTQILDNPKPITTMKAYLDNSLVATSSGPTLQSEVSGAPDGTHILTIQGWDDTGIEYRYQENININVHE